jgi:5-methylcytosine-specific restriction endonuclease McrA
MARQRIVQFYGLDQSIFNGKTHRRSKKAMRLVSDVGPPTKRDMINQAFCAFVMDLCGRARIGSGSTIEAAATKLAGRPLSASAAWEWMLAEFLRARCEFDTAKYDSIIQQARRRIATVRGSEQKNVQLERVRREAKAVRKQHEEERRANGREASFFDSNKWQRLRYDVLVASNGQCTLCGRSTREHGVILHVDHIKPRSRFPNLALVRSNLQVLCEDCNLGKSNRDTIDWRVDSGNDNLGEKVA